MLLGRSSARNRRRMGSKRTVTNEGDSGGKGERDSSECRQKSMTEKSGVKNSRFGAHTTCAGRSDPGRSDQGPFKLGPGNRQKWFFDRTMPFSRSAHSL